MRTQQQMPQRKAVKISRGSRRLKPCRLQILLHGTMSDPRKNDPRKTPITDKPIDANNVFEDDSSDDEKCKVLRIYEEEDPGLASEHDLFPNKNQEGTTAENPIDLTQSDESSDEEVDDYV